MKPGTAAWVATIGGILLYEALAPEGQLMSESVDRALIRHPIVVRIALAAVCLHLANLLPTSIDPLHHLGKLRVRR